LDDPTKWTACDLLDKTKQMIEKGQAHGDQVRLIVLVCLEDKEGVRDTYVAQRGIEDDIAVLGWLEMFKAEAIDMLEADID